MLRIGLAQSIKTINGQYSDVKVLNEMQVLKIKEKSQGWPYFNLSSYFVDDRDNLRDIMR